MKILTAISILNKLNTGVYFVTLKIDGLYLKTEKFIIIR